MFERCWLGVLTNYQPKGQALARSSTRQNCHYFTLGISGKALLLFHPIAPQHSLSLTGNHFHVHFLSAYKAHMRLNRGSRSTRVNIFILDFFFTSASSCYVLSFIVQILTGLEKEPWMEKMTMLSGACFPVPAH